MATPGRNGVFSPLPEGRTRSVTMSSVSSGMGRDQQKNSYINRMLQGGGLSALNRNEQEVAKTLLSPDEFSKYGLGKDPNASQELNGWGQPTGGAIDANQLLDLYQKGLGVGSSQGPSTDDQIRLLREGNELDLKRKRAEQDMQMEGQEQALQQTREARAKERETEANLQRRQQQTERSNAMSAYKGL